MGEGKLSGNRREGEVKSRGLFLKKWKMMKKNYVKEGVREVEEEEGRVEGVVKGR